MPEKAIRPKTIFLDIDGTILTHMGSLSAILKDNVNQRILQDVVRTLNIWEAKGYNIILVTGRKECMRAMTKVQLLRMGIFFDQLIMGCGGGARYLINDNKPDGEKSAFAVNVERNVGLTGLDSL